MIVTDVEKLRQILADAQEVASKRARALYEARGEWYGEPSEWLASEEGLEGQWRGSGDHETMYVSYEYLTPSDEEFASMIQETAASTAARRAAATYEAAREREARDRRQLADLLARYGDQEVVE